ncbi:MAG TPA: cytochrome c maturation protein CcmE [Longimicrobiales bacterium]|nr:cytochrome c maturation protein CcmE [Longimicrobiales bacterium]
MGKPASRRIALVVGGAIVAAAVVFMYFGLNSNLVFWLTPTEVVEMGESAYETPIRLAGMVSTGSVEWDADRIDLRFIVEDYNNRIEVRTKTAPPMMFQEGIEVVVEGRLTRAGVFEASNVMVMHSNEYRELPDDHPPPEERYRQLLGEATP